MQLKKNFLTIVDTVTPSDDVTNYNNGDPSASIKMISTAGSLLCTTCAA